MRQEDIEKCMFIVLLNIFKIFVPYIKLHMFLFFELQKEIFYI